MNVELTFQVLDKDLREASKTVGLHYPGDLINKTVHWIGVGQGVVKQAWLHEGEWDITVDISEVRHRDFKIEIDRVTGHSITLVAP